MLFFSNIKKQIALAMAFILSRLGFISKNDYENYKFNLMFLGSEKSEKKDI